jgi:hypothetical protein
MSAIAPDHALSLLTQTGSRGTVVLLGLMAILLLMLLLVEREVLRATVKPGDAPRGRILDIAIIPLVLVFILVIFERLYRLII